jgi:hypothetical protein
MNGGARLLQVLGSLLVAALIVLVVILGVTAKLGTNPGEDEGRDDHGGGGSGGGGRCHGLQAPTVGTDQSLSSSRLRTLPVSLRGSESWSTISRGTL